VEKGFKTVTCASPNHEFLKEHEKNKSMRKRFMPLCIEREIIEAAELLDLNLYTQLIQNLMGLSDISLASQGLEQSKTPYEQHLCFPSQDQEISVNLQ
jgi:hypothetical protein